MQELPRITVDPAVMAGKKKTIFAKRGYTVRVVGSVPSRDQRERYAEPVNLFRRPQSH